MKKIVVLGLLLVMMMSLIPATAVMASGPPDDSHWNGFNRWPPQPNDSAWAALYQKNPDTWINILGGGRGLLMYDPKGPEFSFKFTADRLAANTNYSLIYYADKPDRFVNWGGNFPGAFIAKGKSNSKGEIYLTGSVNLGMDLPSPPDANFATGAKIWLVLSSDYDQTKCMLTAWNPSSYLLDDSSRLVNYDDTNVASTKLVMKSGDPDWNVINADTTFGWLWYTPVGKKFGFNFDGYGLQATTAYSLIYYADPYPGNNPGALIAAGTTAADGSLSLSGLVDLGMNLPSLPDANYPTGAKIWLVPSSDYNAATHAFTAWNPGNYLFETNLIKYKKF